MNEQTKKLIKERGAIYGDYKGGAQFRSDMMKLIENRYRDVHREHMSNIDKIYISDIVYKLSRITVTPNHLDSWKDISGYAERVIEVIEKEERDANK